MQRTREKYLTDEYEQFMTSFAESHPVESLSTEMAVDIFLEECENKEAAAEDAQPLSEVRRVAFNRMELRISDGEF